MTTNDLADIGLIGLAVMGQNLVLNMNDHGFRVCVFNRTVSKVDDFLANEAKATKVIGAHSIVELVSRLRSPKKIMLLVKAGDVVDQFIDQLVKHLSAGDIIIDGGNSQYLDTDRRCSSLAAHGLLFIGTGVSGGEEGARFGPSLMPGGNADAWPQVQAIFQSICAKVDSGQGQQEPCCDWAGTGGSGHFVKMVHNGIEYADMQLISEAYQLLRDHLHLTNEEMADIFQRWNKGNLESFLVQITAEILRYRDTDGNPLVDRIRDTAGQKGTGKWTAICGLEHGTPITLIAESVFARSLSAIKEEREAASKRLPAPSRLAVDSLTQAEKEAFIEDVQRALYASKIISYAQGFMLLRKAKEVFGWELNLGNIALMWRGGCIIRSRFLANIKKAFEQDRALASLMLDPFFTEALADCQEGWRRVVAKACLVGIPVPAFSCALSYYDGYRCPFLAANLIQAQRDYFGAHQYELLANPGTFVHTDWTGHGGAVASTTYQV